MEKNQGMKRLPVLRGDKLVGIVSRSNLLQAVASLARQIPDPTADDDHIRNRIIDALEKKDWCPFGLSVVVRRRHRSSERRHYPRGTFAASHYCRCGERCRSKEGS